MYYLYRFASKYPPEQSQESSDTARSRPTAIDSSSCVTVSSLLAYISPSRIVRLLPPIVAVIRTVFTSRAITLRPTHRKIRTLARPVATNWTSLPQCPDNRPTSPGKSRLHSTVRPVSPSLLVRTCNLHKYNYCCPTLVVVSSHQPHNSTRSKSQPNTVYCMSYRKWTLVTHRVVDFVVNSTAHSSGGHILANT